MKKAFTMIELIFVVVVLGILAAVAIPRFAATRGDAQVAKYRADISAIRSAIISERQQRLFRGNPAFIAALDNGGNALFGGLAGQVLLQNPIQASPGAGGWATAGNGLNYTATISQTSGGINGAANFVYTPATGVFDCAGGAGTVCGLLTD